MASAKKKSTAVARRTTVQADPQTGEILGSGGLPSAVSAGVVQLKGPTVNLATLKIKRLVTLPQLKIINDTDYYVRIDGAIYVGQKLKDDEKKDPPHLAPVVNLVDGMPYLMIFNAVVKSELERTYPDNGYVGKAFVIRVSKLEGKRYKQAQIAEIEMEAEAAE